MNIDTCVRLNYSQAIISVCKERGQSRRCRIKLDNLNDVIILKGEKLSTEKITDCIIFKVVFLPTIHAGKR